MGLFEILDDEDHPAADLHLDAQPIARAIARTFDNVGASVGINVRDGGLVE